MGADMQVSGIVLAGGMSRRLGRNKAIEPIGGEPLLQRVIGRLSQVSDDALVVVADAAQGSELPVYDPVRTAVDVYPGSGSLGGIFTGLSAADREWGIVVACDMPFLNVELLNQMLSLRERCDAVVPVLNGRPEPTHAVYSKACLSSIERRLKASDLKITRFFDEVQVNYMPQHEVERTDPEHLSFMNVNTQEDLDQALALVSAGQ